MTSVTIFIQELRGHMEDQHYDITDGQYTCKTCQFKPCQGRFYDVTDDQYTCQFKP